MRNPVFSVLAVIFCLASTNLFADYNQALDLFKQGKYQESLKAAADALDVAKDADPAPVGTGQSGQAGNQCGFSGAIGAEQSEEFSGCDSQSDAAQGVQGTKGFVHVNKGNGSLRHGGFSLRSGGEQQVVQAVEFRQRPGIGGGTGKTDGNALAVGAALPAQHDGQSRGIGGLDGGQIEYAAALRQVLLAFCQ